MRKILLAAMLLTGALSASKISCEIYGDEMMAKTKTIRFKLDNNMTIYTHEVDSVKHYVAKVMGECGTTKIEKVYIQYGKDAMEYFKLVFK